MPTPFYHIVLAEEIIDDMRLRQFVRNLLSNELSSFLFGSVAPDVQSISNYTREATHFFSIDNVKKNVAYQEMLAEHKNLSDGRRLSSQRAAFVAGYLAHLLLDQAWIMEVFNPVFSKTANWGEFRERLFLHNVLRTFLDQQDYNRLSSDINKKFSSTMFSARWLPFVENTHFKRWHKFLSEQLADGSSPRTIEVFAARMGRQPEDFEEILLSNDLMEERIFSRISRTSLEKFRQRVLDNSIVLINHYFSSDLVRV